DTCAPSCRMRCETAVFENVCEKLQRHPKLQHVSGIHRLSIHAECRKTILAAQHVDFLDKSGYELQHKGKQSRVTEEQRGVIQVHKRTHFSIEHPVIRYRRRTVTVVSNERAAIGYIKCS